MNWCFWLTTNYQKESQNDPSWDGELSGWPDYVRRVRLQYETTARRKRHLLGPRLALRLTGKAWEASTNIQHEMLRKSNGAKYLLLFLREKLGKTPIPDAAQRLEDLFIRLRRTPGTPFTRPTSVHSELLYVHDKIRSQRLSHR